MQDIDDNPTWDSKTTLIPVQYISSVTKSLTKLNLSEREKKYVPFIIYYLQNGIIPPANNDDMFFTCKKLSDYFMAEKLLLYLKYSNEELNVLHKKDRLINNDLHTLIQLESKMTIKYKNINYPIFKKAKDKFKRLENGDIQISNDIQSQLHENFKCHDRCKRSNFIHDVFKHLKDKVILCGGSLHSLFRIYDCRLQDLDFFVLDKCNIKEIISTLAFLYHKYYKQFYIMRTSCACTLFSVQYNHRPVVQVIYNMSLKSINLILNSFDLDASCFAYDGDHIYTNRRGFRYLSTGYNVVDTTKTSRTFEHRLKKYFSQYGAGIAIPGFIPDRLVLVKNQTPVGLTRLIKNNYNDDKFESGNYFCYNVAESYGVGSLVKSLTDYLKNNNMFIIRQDCLTLWDAMDERETMFLKQYDQIQHTSMNFNPLNGPWYAQAYGASSIPYYKKQIDKLIYDRQYLGKLKQYKFGDLSNIDIQLGFNSGFFSIALNNN